MKIYQTQADAPFEYEDRLSKMDAELNRLERKLQGEKVEDAPSENYTLEEEPSRLKEAQATRTQRAQTMDLSKKHSVVIEPISPKTQTWLKRPGSMDIQGIDTPHSPKISERMGNISEPKGRVSDRRLRISGRVGRISPRMPRLK